MAKIKWGALVVDGRGKSGGTVLSKNKDGAYLKNKVSPVNRRATAQTQTRGRLGYLAQLWREIDDTKRIAWNAAVDQYKKTNIFGDVKVPSGFQLFVRLNRNLIQSGTAVIEDIPVLTSPPTILFTSAAFASVAGTKTLTWSISATANSKIIIEATPPLAPGISSATSKLRYIGNCTGVTATPYDIKTIYEAKFGSSTPAGHKVFFRLKVISTISGMDSATVIGVTTVAA